MHAATEAVGLIASITSFLLWVPQGVRVWRHRRDADQLRGIALSTQVIALTGAVLWVAYAALIDSFWLGAPIVVTGPVAAMTIVVLVRGRRAADPADVVQAATLGQTEPVAADAVAPAQVALAA